MPASATTLSRANAPRGLRGLLNDILDFSKIEAGHLGLDPHPTRLDELLCDLSVILAAHGDKRGIEVLFDLTPPCRPSSSPMRCACSRC